MYEGEMNLQKSYPIYHIKYIGDFQLLLPITQNYSQTI